MYWFWFFLFSISIFWSSSSALTNFGKTKKIPFQCLFRILYKHIGRIDKIKGDMSCRENNQKNFFLSFSDSLRKKYRKINSIIESYVWKQQQEENNLSSNIFDFHFSLLFILIDGQNNSEKLENNEKQKKSNSIWKNWCQKFYYSTEHIIDTFDFFFRQLFQKKTVHHHHNYDHY